jgi:uncharacterized protein
MSDPYGPPPGGYGQQPGTGALSQDDKTWALLAHIGSLVSAWFAFGFVAPLIVMLVKGDSPFVRRHAVESLNFQISMLIYSIVGGIAAVIVVLVTFGIGALIVVPLIAVVLVVILVLVLVATVKASNGEDYRYPLTIRLIS